MLRKYKIPKTIIWIVNLFLIFMLMFTLFRVAIYVAFCPKDLSFTSLLSSFTMGLRYDARWVSIFLLPVVLISLQPRFSPFFSIRNSKYWSWYLAFITFIVIFFFAADFGNFSYNRTRLDAGALNFYEDPKISWQMMRESYPVFWIFFGLIAVVVIFRWMYKRSHKSVKTRTDGLGIPYHRKWFIISSLIMLFFIYGRAGWAPLTWKTVFVLKDNFKSYLALNPMQKFFTTIYLRNGTFDKQKVKESYPILADWMGWPDKENFNFKRDVLPAGSSLESKPNVVLVMCESFSMYKSSMSGNKLNTTPYFNELAQKGIFFKQCFSPQFSTARGLFAILTGIPDVQLYKFSTRNPEALNQHTIINNFEDYKKMYFLGGSSEFNNFEGLLKNIDSLQMFTEGKFKSPKVNVWGISDKDLFLEANDVFKKQNKPFFAFIQTADNHRPYMIPQSDSDFQKITIEKEELLQNGFESAEEYNSFRYSDYCFKKFIEIAQQEDYFHNTIFVFIGDHGVTGNAKAVYPSVWTHQRLTDNHVPLLFYAPYLLQPQQRSETVSQIDILPTVAGMINQPYTNTTLGRDLLRPGKKNNSAFIVFQDITVGMVTDSFYFTKNINFPDEQLYPLKDEGFFLTKTQLDSVKMKMSALTSAYYETAKWMLMNNKKKD
jgi:phosphoglycerol transferase MdoB-like AlkP superfamily enzyme